MLAAGEVVLFALLILIMPMIGWVIFAYQLWIVRQAFKQLASSHDGEYSSSHPLYLVGKGVEFFHNDKDALIEIRQRNMNAWSFSTQFSIAWPDNLIHCQVYSKGFFRRLGALISRRSVKTGVRRFDERYIVISNSHDRIQSLLSPHVQMAIEQLRQISGIRDVRVKWQEGRLVVEAPTLIRDYPSLALFTSLATGLYDLAIGTSTEGIEFTQSSSESSDNAICKVCGDALEKNIVYCRSCDTPHHRECWRFYGACSVYACGEKKFTKARRRECTV